MSGTKKSISLPQDMWDRAEQRAQALGYTKMSHYFQQLVREDLLEQGAHVRIAEPKTPYGEQRKPTTPSPSKAGSGRRVVDILKARRAKKKAADTHGGSAPGAPEK